MKPMENALCSGMGFQVREEANFQPTLTELAAQALGASFFFGLPFTSPL